MPLLWLVVAPFALYWRWVVMPAWFGARRFLDPHTMASRDRLTARLAIARTILVTVGAALAELQWRWGTPELGKTAADWLDGVFIGPVYVAIGVFMCSIVLVATARRGMRWAMVRRVLLPLRVILICALVIAVLPASAWAFGWIQSERQSALAWASDGIAGLLTIVVAIVLMAACLVVPPLLVSGAWLAARGSFRAGDAHPLLPAAAATLAGLFLIATPVVDQIGGRPVEPDYPVWAGLTLGIVLPAASVVISSIEFIRLITIGGWGWRTTYEMTPTS